VAGGSERAGRGAEQNAACIKFSPKRRDEEGFLAARRIAALARAALHHCPYRPGWLKPFFAARNRPSPIITPCSILFDGSSRHTALSRLAGGHMLGMPHVGQPSPWQACSPHPESPVGRLIPPLATGGCRGVEFSAA
jgi:hypothetical protein